MEDGARRLQVPEHRCRRLSPAPPRRGAGGAAVTGGAGRSSSVGSVGRNSGLRRACVAASKPLASLISVGSLYAVPMNVRPTGSPNESPAGTLING